MQYFRRLLSRLRAWRAGRQATAPAPAPAPAIVPDFSALAASIGRDVSRNGVRFYSLCGGCGSRMEISATLCDDCAQKRSGFPGGY